jgi:1-deoxy-D-xylulose-5-phosphate reductoisomerase
MLLDPTSLTILGSTGSIGQQTLEVVAAHPEQFRVVGLGGGVNIELLAEQVRRFQPALVAIANSDKARDLRPLLPAGTRLLVGEAGLCELAASDSATLVVSAIAGLAGLAPTLAAVRAGKRVAIANKEPIVVAGELLLAEAAAANATILPVDSEHSALFQLLEGRDKNTINKIILTGSGGPFREAPEELDCVNSEQALSHPTWKMGKKVTIDSATLMNKGLEVIEAHRLFDMELDKIKVVIHPESVVHAMVEFNDGVVLAHMASPDMRIPIQYALSYPKRLGPVWSGLDFTRARSLSFMPPDLGRFPCLRLAREAAQAGGTATAVLNAADEVAVAAFLAGRIKFTDIPRLVEKALSEHNVIVAPGLEAILETDKQVRAKMKVQV